MAIPLYTTGSLSPTFVPARPVGLAVKLPFAFALCEWFPSILKENCPALSTAYNDVEQIAQKKEEAGFVRIENIDYHDIDKDNLPEVWEKKTPENYDEATLQRIQLSVKELIDNGVLTTF